MTREGQRGEAAHGEASIIRPVERALHAAPAAVEHVGIHHGGPDIVVPEQFLHGAKAQLHASNVVAAFDEMGSKGVSKGVACDPFRNT